MDRIDSGFFMRDPVSCAKELIACHFMWRGCVVRIVETEAYAEFDDPACHTWFKPSARSFIEQHAAGDAYVYLNYGVHWLFNILVKGGPRGGFVLLRAVEPVAGVELMSTRRPGVTHELLGSGPGKLTRMLGIDGSAHGAKFLDAADCGLWRANPIAEVCAGPRIGIARAAELAWRFGDPASRALSRRFPPGSAGKRRG